MTVAYATPNRDTLTFDEIREYANRDRASHSATLAQRSRTRAIMDGGIGGMQALLGPDVDLGEGGTDLPAANLMFSGMERLAQKLGQPPIVKVDPNDDDEKDISKRRAAKTERIIETYDEIGRLELQLHQLGRWVPGYGFGVMLVREKEINRARYPVAQLRDPYNCFPGWWGPDQQPQTLTVVRQVPGATLRRLYPRYADKFSDDGPGLSANWEGFAGNYTVVDFYDTTGSYCFCEDPPVLLEATPNALGIPRFVVPHRSSFNQLIGQFEHVVGIMAMMAKVNVLAAAAMEDGVETETNIFGQLRSNTYKKGRFAVNEFEPSARVEKPTSNLPYQLFEHIDRLERQIRLTGGYPITDDAESPNSFVTGRGLEELGAGASRIVTEYQTIFRWALQDLDALRLRWDEEYYGPQRKPLFGVRDGVPFSEKYTPEVDIAGRTRTRRVYGMMAGWDDPTKIVTGIQLLNNQVIDVETFQENLRGLSNLPKINDRIRRKAVEGQLLAGLGARFGQGDPQAALTLIDMYRNIGDFETALLKFNTPEEPQMTPEQEAMLGQAQGPQIPEQPRPIATVLSRLESSGAIGGGSQVVNVRRG